MKNDRLHAFVVRRTVRSRARIHRISIHKNWLKASVAATLIVCTVALYGLYALAWQPVAAARLADENERLRHENEIHRQQLDALADRIEAVEDTSRRIAEVSGVEEAAPQGAGGPALPLDEVETDTAINFIAHRAANLEQEILSFEAILRERTRTPSALPAEGNSTDSFGVRSNPFGGAEAEFHAGLDIAAPTGTSVVTGGTGEVTFAGFKNGYGNVVMIDHGNGYETRYAHLSQINTGVGASVTRGDLIGRVGSTGRSTGPHLHYEVRLGGRPLNPRRYLPVKN
jgi:murein DD-endopeptidase MepM/ murein hydrolase activator NlpD